MWNIITIWVFFFTTAMPAFVMLYFNFIFTVAKNAEHFQIFIGHCVYPFEDCLFSYLANLLIRRFFFLALIFSTLGKCSFWTTFTASLSSHTLCCNFYMGLWIFKFCPWFLWWPHICVVSLVSKTIILCFLSVMIRYKESFIYVCVHVCVW